MLQRKPHPTLVRPSLVSTSGIQTPQPSSPSELMETAIIGLERNGISREILLNKLLSKLPYTSLQSVTQTLQSLIESKSLEKPDLTAEKLVKI